MNETVTSFENNQLRQKQMRDQSFTAVMNSNFSGRLRTKCTEG